MTAATGQMLRLNEFSDSKNFLKDFMPLLVLRKHQLFLQLGHNTLAVTYLKQLTRLFPKDSILQKCDIQNQIYHSLTTMEPCQALQFFNYMLKYGFNPEVLDVFITYYLICYKQQQRHGN